MTLVEQIVALITDREVELRQHSVVKNPDYTEERLMRAGYKLAADVCVELREAINALPKEA